MSIIETVKNAFQSVKNKLTTLDAEVSSLGTSIEKLEDFKAYEVVEGLTINEFKNNATYVMDKNLYVELYRVWRKNLIPMLKIKYGDDNRYRFIYLPCTLQRWDYRWTSSISSSMVVAFVTESFISSGFKEAKLVIRQGNTLSLVTTNASYDVKKLTNAAITYTDSDSGDSDSSSDSESEDSSSESK